MAQNPFLPEPTQQQGVEERNPFLPMHNFKHKQAIQT